MMYTKRFLVGAVLFAIFSAMAASTSAGMMMDTQVSYSLRVSESLEVLKKPNDMNAAMMAAWTTPTQLAMERNQPYLLLKNTSTVANGGSGTAALTGFTLTIGDRAQNFDALKIISTSPGVKVTFQNIDGKQGGQNADFVRMAFTGLTPGKQVIFQVDIDPDKNTASPFADYRMVFFRMNGGSNDAGNSETRARFVDNGKPAGFKVAQLPLTTWDNPTVTKPTVVGNAFQANYMNDHVTSFTTGDVGLQPVPEPSTLALLGLGGFGFAAFAYRRRFRAT